MISIEDFSKLELRVGTVDEVKEFPEAKKPAFILKIDFGQFGKKYSSARITDRYSPGSLIGKQVICAMNLPPLKMGHFTSEVLVLGVKDDEGKTVLLRPEKDIQNGTQVR